MASPPPPSNNWTHIEGSDFGLNNSDQSSTTSTQKNEMSKPFHVVDSSPSSLPLFNNDRFSGATATASTPIFFPSSSLSSVSSSPPLSIGVRGGGSGGFGVGGDQYQDRYINQYQQLLQQQLQQPLSPLSQSILDDSRYNSMMMTPPPPPIPRPQSPGAASNASSSVASVGYYSRQTHIGIVNPRSALSSISGTDATGIGGGGGVGGSGNIFGTAPGVASSDTSPPVPLSEASKSNILSIINLFNEYVLSHPFIVFRRQAQVNNRSNAYHLTPFTVVPYMIRIQTNQGLGAFFKGLPSILVNYAMLAGTESLLYNLLQFPIEFDFTLWSPFSIRLLKHLALKSLSILVVTPFICASAVETVQSLIVADAPSPLDSIREGIGRIFHFRYDRKLPLHRLIGPSIMYHLSYYVMYSITKEVIAYVYFYNADDDDRDRDRHHQRDHYQTSTTVDTFTLAQQFNDNDGTNYGHPPTASWETAVVSPQLKSPPPLPLSFSSSSSMKSVMTELKCSLYANVLTDIVLYPFQTVLYRLFLQGTRTLIDNVDGRTAVIPLISNYESASDCYHTIIQQEGTGGLYKGFGALVLQYVCKASLIHLANYCINVVFHG